MSDKNLFQRLLAIQNKVRYIQKGGYNSFHKYKYVQEADIIEAVKTASIEEGVFLAFSMTDTGTVSTADKGDIITYVLTELTAVNVDNPTETIVIKGGGHGSDKLDKGIYKALTGANKYMLSKLFQIATGDDPEVEEGKPKGSQVKDINALKDIIADELPKCKNIIHFKALNKRWKDVVHEYDDADIIADIDAMFAKRKIEMEQPAEEQPNDLAESLEASLSGEHNPYVYFEQKIEDADTEAKLKKIGEDIKASTDLSDKDKDMLRKRYNVRSKELKGK